MDENNRSDCRYMMFECGSCSNHSIMIDDISQIEWLRDMCKICGDNNWTLVKIVLEGDYLNKDDVEGIKYIENMIKDMESGVSR